MDLPATFIKLGVNTRAAEKSTPYLRRARLRLH